MLGRWCMRGESVMQSCQGRMVCWCLERRWQGCRYQCGTSSGAVGDHYPRGAEVWTRGRWRHNLEMSRTMCVHPFDRVLCPGPRGSPGGLKGWWPVQGFSWIPPWQGSVSGFQIVLLHWLVQIFDRSVQIWRWWQESVRRTPQPVENEKRSYFIFWLKALKRKKCCYF